MRDVLAKHGAQQADSICILQAHARHLVLLGVQLQPHCVALGRDGRHLRVEHAFDGMHLPLYRFRSR
jgi:hypothetical protein